MKSIIEFIYVDGPNCRVKVRCASNSTITTEIIILKSELRELNIIPGDYVDIKINNWNN